MKRLRLSSRQSNTYLKEAATLMDIEGCDQDWKPTRRQAAALCMEEVCLLPDIFVDELLPIIKARMRHDVTWQVRYTSSFFT